ncbi:hypothetical protein MIND_01171500 [Mycena indigotica]|uniref:Uncharacterized protein n=1 Tax=Mycena indigotica TaxID=2126181 RepID=A0A8H6S5E0_9AGAR|nr:uncharacterized protein MIND_01171500 [Mycena indigotica]KAF7292732.1 hypothetical protein MIND_01171500 [Mycena indigotica]
MASFEFPSLIESVVKQVAQYLDEQPDLLLSLLDASPSLRIPIFADYVMKRQSDSGDDDIQSDSGDDDIQSDSGGDDNPDYEFDISRNFNPSGSSTPANKRNQRVAFPGSSRSPTGGPRFESTPSRQGNSDLPQSSDSDSDSPANSLNVERGSLTRSFNWEGTSISASNDHLSNVPHDASYLFNTTMPDVEVTDTTLHKFLCQPHTMISQLKPPEMPHARNSQRPPRHAETKVTPLNEICLDTDFAFYVILFALLEAHGNAFIQHRLTAEELQRMEAGPKVLNCWPFVFREADYQTRSFVGESNMACEANNILDGKGISDKTRMFMHAGVTATVDDHAVISDGEITDVSIQEMKTQDALDFLQTTKLTGIDYKQLEGYKRHGEAIVLEYHPPTQLPIKKSKKKSSRNVHDNNEFLSSDTINVNNEHLVQAWTQMEAKNINFGHASSHAYGYVAFRDPENNPNRLYISPALPNFGDTVSDAESVRTQLDDNDLAIPSQELVAKGLELLGTKPGEDFYDEYREALSLGPQIGVYVMAHMYYIAKDPERAKKWRKWYHEKVSGRTKHVYFKSRKECYDTQFTKPSDAFQRARSTASGTVGVMLYSLKAPRPKRIPPPKKGDPDLREPPNYKDRSQSFSLSDLQVWA